MMLSCRFEVSEVLSKMLPSPAEEAPHVKVNESKTLASSKSTRRYMPYSNVGSFLKMCKNLGLNGIDLFIPSDVVEKRNTRKVCMCIRSLSKKVRSRDINVPDFDSVTCTLAMPTDMVEGIRKSLELSQCSSSLSVGHDSEKISRVRYLPRMSNSDSVVSNGDSSDNCDDAESRFILAESNGPSNSAFCLTSPTILGSQLIIDHSSSPELQSNKGDLEDKENVQCEYLSPSIPESVSSPCSVYYRDQELSSLPYSTFLASLVTGINGKGQDEHKKGVVNHVPIDWGDISSDDDYRDPGIDEIGLISHGKDDPDSGIENLSCSSEIGFGETSPCPENEHTHNDAAKHGMLACELVPEVGKPYLYRMVKDNHLPVQLIQTTHHVSSHAENLDSSFNDGNHVSQVSTKASNNANTASEDSWDAMIVSDIHPSFTKNDMAFDVNVFTSDHTEKCNDNNFIGHNGSDPMDMPDLDLNYSPYMVEAKDDKKCPEQDSQDTQEVFEDHNIRDENIDGKPVNVEDTTLCNPWPEAERLENVEGTGHKHHQCSENMEKVVSEEKGMDKEKPQSKPQRTLLKSVVKGTALVGVAVFLLLLRKKSKAHIPKVKKQPIEVPKERPPKKPSSQKAEKGGSSSSVYPAQKLHLGI